MKIKQLILALSLLLPLNAYPKKSNESKNFGVGLAIAGAIGVAVGGLIAAASSWFETSNAALISDARQTLEEYNSQYSPLIQNMCEYFQIKNLSTGSSWQSVTTVEPLLYSIALRLSANKQSWNRFCSQFSYFIRSVGKARAALNKRIGKLQARNNDYQTRQELAEMRSLEVSLLWTENESNVLYNYLCSRHSAYFALAQKEWELYHEYAQEIELLNQHGHNTYYTEQELSNIIKRKHRNAKYPFLRYYNLLEPEINSLQKLYTKAYCTEYAERCLWSYQLLEMLNRTSFIVDPWYRYELALWEKDELERKRLALEREKIALLAEQNYAIHRQNVAIEEQNRQLEINRITNLMQKSLHPAEEVSLIINVQN